MKTIILSLDDIRTIVGHVGQDRLMDETVERLLLACRDYEQQKFEVPERDGFEYSLPRMGLLEWMPVMQKGSCATLKVVGYHPHNPKQHALPTILSVSLAFNTETGHLIGMVDGTFPTAVRTGAASTVASRILAKPDSSVLGLIGAGAQSITQLHALSRAFDFREVLVFDTDFQTATSFARRIDGLGLQGLSIRTPPLEELLARSDIICTATSVSIGDGPVFADGETQAHLHINAVGSDFPGKTEMPRTLLERALVCPDFRGQAIREGECQQLSPDRIGPDLVEITKHPDDYAKHRAGLTVFDSTGWALEDHVMMEILVGHARELGCGSMVQIESVSNDPKDPYAFLSGGDVVQDGTQADPCRLFAIDRA